MIPATSHRLKRTSAIVGSIALTGAVMSIMIVALGANPVDVALALWQGAFGSAFTIGQTVSTTGILILMGLAALVPFSARLFNVGGEGQLFAGAIATVTVALAAGDFAALLPVALFAGVVGGAAWALIPGLLRTFFGASEMIVSLLLNFVAALAAAYVITEVVPDSTGQATLTVDRALRLPTLWAAGGVNVGIVLVLVVFSAVWLMMTRTRLGFGIRASGLNPQAATLAGFSARTTTVLTFAIGGACAGLAGSLLVLGTAGQLNQGIAANYGFLGVVVALLCGLKAVWLPAAAVLIAALSVGSNRLQLAVDLPFSLGIVIVGVLVLTLLATRVITIKRS
jgi:ABC-type uncharacterized transport system permease subunit